MAKKYTDLSIFEGTKPLHMIVSCPFKYMPWEKDRPEDPDNFYGIGKDSLYCKPLDPIKYTNLSFWSDYDPANGKNIHFINSNPLLVDKAILDKFTILCPDQFEYFPVIITNKDGRHRKFVNRDFYLINLLNFIDAVDLEKSISSKGFKNKKPINDIIYSGKLVFKENPWPEGVLVGRNLYSSARILFHPSLAKHFIKENIVFYTDELEVCFQYPFKPMAESW